MKKNRFGSKKWLLFAVITSLLSMSVYTSVTYVMGKLVDDAMNKDLESMVKAGKVIAIVVFLTLVLNSLDAIVSTRFKQKSIENLKKHYINRLMKLNIQQVQRDKIPTMLSQLTNDFDRYETKYIEKIVELLQSLSQFITATVLLGVINKYLVFGAIAMLLIFSKVSKKVGEPIKKTEDKKTKSLNRYTEYINETFLGFEIIKQHQLEPIREEIFLKHATQVQDDNYLVDKKATNVEAINGFAINTVLYAVVIVGMIFAANANMSLGNVIVIFSAFSNIMWPVRNIAPLITDMNGIGTILDEMDKTLAVIEDDRDVHIDGFEKLEFVDADLGYEDGVILSHVNISINRGEKVLIIGPSGAGKSTILKTLRQTIIPSDGYATMNGSLLQDIYAMDYYSKFSIVDQIGFLFDGTIKDNITLYQNFSDEEVRSILDSIGLKELALDMAVINDGNNMSGGQRARIMLARALCLNAEIIMCDEIFASLDLDIARSIEYDLLAFNNTIINVSHIMFDEHLPKYDKIYIVEGGSVKMASTIEEVQKRMLEHAHENEEYEVPN